MTVVMTAVTIVTDVIVVAHVVLIELLTATVPLTTVDATVVVPSDVIAVVPLDVAVSVPEDIKHIIEC